MWTSRFPRIAKAVGAQRGGKYLRRIPRPGGGYTYVYAEPKRIAGKPKIDEHATTKHEHIKRWSDYGHGKGGEHPHYTEAKEHERKGEKAKAAMKYADFGHALLTAYDGRQTEHLSRKEAKEMHGAINHVFHRSAALAKESGHKHAGINAHAGLSTLHGKGRYWANKKIGESSKEEAMKLAKDEKGDHIKTETGPIRHPKHW